tara:strand:- start:17180 stop:17671 length:492 start_codon:yes stop_codon:yes gene_type:complete
MKKFIPNVISREESLFLLNSTQNSIKWNRSHLLKDINLSNTNDITNIIIKILNIVDVPNRSDKSYFRLESSTEGSVRTHPWHVDTGSKNHMSWCKYGISILLSEPTTFKGAELEYRDGTIITKEKHYLGLTMHSSDVEHRLRWGIESSDKKREGERRTLLFFL